MAATRTRKYTLSARQEVVLEFVESFIAVQGYPPTIREIMRHTGIPSTSVVSYYIDQLVEWGFLAKEDKVSRGLRVIKPRVNASANMVRVPLVECAITESYQSLPRYGSKQTLPASWLAEDSLDEVYALKVDTHLMYDAMVNEGDVMVLQRQHVAEDGDTVVVIIQPKGETRIRKIRYEGDCIYLEPLLRMIQPQKLPTSQVQVVGKVLGLMRQF